MGKIGGEQEEAHVSSFDKFLKSVFLFDIKEGSMGGLFCQAQSVFVFAGKRICILQAGVSVFCRPSVFALVGLSRLSR